jgi:OmpA-OmpF porin, OOP family
MQKLLILAIASLLVAAPAAAQDLPKVYAGVTIGSSKAKAFCDELSGPGITCDDGDTSLRLLGGYQFHKNFAVELGALYLGEVQARGPGGTFTVESAAIEALGVAMLPLAERFSVYGKAGIYRAVTEARLNTVVLTDTAEETNFDLTFGFGVRVDLAKNLFLRGEWQRYTDVGGDEVGKSDIDVLSIGLLFKF